MALPRCCHQCWSSSAKQVCGVCDRIHSTVVSCIKRQVSFHIIASTVVVRLFFPYFIKVKSNNIKWSNSRSKEGEKQFCDYRVRYLSKNEKNNINEIEFSTSEARFFREFGTRK